MKRFLFFAALAAAAATVALAADAKVNIPVHRTAANNGQQMYTSYCAPCHGVDGRGNGPEAKLLPYTPTDLTMLSRDNRGVFPVVHVISVIKFGVAQHGAASNLMPDWGPLLSRMDQAPSDVSPLRIHNIVTYLEKLQAH